MESVSIPWTRRFFKSHCPCRSGKPAYDCCWRGNGRWEKKPAGVIAPETSDFAHERCYLSLTGNCSRRITREHFISRSILERITKSTLKFENASHFFGGKATVEIGIEAFSAKVLCDAHNSALSVLDDAAGLAFAKAEDLFLDLTRVATARKASYNFYLSSGVNIERWMIKVYCGLVAAGRIRGINGTTVKLEELPSCLIETLVGQRVLASPFGLYSHSYVGQSRKSGGFTFGTIQLTNGSDAVGGLILALGIMNFVLVTSDLYGKVFQDANWYRHPSFLFNVRQSGSRVAYLLTY